MAWDLLCIGGRFAFQQVARTAKLQCHAALRAVSQADCSFAIRTLSQGVASGARNGAILLHCVNVDTLVAAVEAAVPRRLTDEEAAEHLPGSGLA